MTFACRTLVVSAVVMFVAACGPSPERTPWPVAGESASPGATEENADAGTGAPEFVRRPGETFVPESMPSTNKDDTAGSGCTPGAGGSLPDGIWRGVIKDADDAEIEFDLICSWAFESETFRKEIVKHEPGDGAIIYVTKNDNKTTRDVAFAADAGTWRQRAGAQPGTVADFLAERKAGAWREAWIFVNDGVVTEISEVYYP